MQRFRVNNPMPSPLGSFFLLLSFSSFPFQLRSRERLIPIPSLIKPSGAAVIFTIFGLTRIVAENDFWRGKESGRTLLAVLGLAVRGPYENEYFRAMWLLQATVYLLFSHPRRQFLVIYRWFEKLMWDASIIIWHNWQNFAFDALAL